MNSVKKIRFKSPKLSEGFLSVDKKFSPKVEAENQKESEIDFRL